MKKSRLLLIAVAALLSVGLASCEKEDNNNDTNDNPTSAFDEMGATRSVFSVSESTQVHFSRGNMQYQASTGTWRFAEHQYDYVGMENDNASATYDGWIDVYAWGTSGWSGVACKPWETEPTLTDTYINGDYNLPMTGEYSNADWAVYNAISNGGNQAGLWRTLTATEWNYLVSREDKCGFATIDGQYTGLVILPDSWTTPEGISFLPLGGTTDTNAYTLAEWDEMELAGAIFLPCAGMDAGYGYTYEGVVGAYWASSLGYSLPMGWDQTVSQHGDLLFFMVPYMDMGYELALRTWDRDMRMSVRPVRAE